LNPQGELLDTARILADIFDGLSLKFAFGGAIAQNYWGTVRATQDIDLLIALPRIRFGEMESALNEAGFTMADPSGKSVPVTVAAMVQEEQDRHLFTVYCNLVKAEIFLPFLPIQHSILRRAVKVSLGERQAPITTAEDLILLKMAFHREKDIWDIRSILWNQKGELDLPYLRQWASQILAQDRADELEGWIRQYGLK
jgi:hypothetical protein